MKLNKKGFTLVEVIAIIAILGLIIIMVTMNTTNVAGGARERAYDNIVGEIQSAAERYAISTNVRAVFVRELVEQGYVGADADGIVRDPRSDANMNCYEVHMEMVAGGIFEATVREADRTNCPYPQRPTPESFITEPVASPLGANSRRFSITTCAVGENILVSSNRGFILHHVCTAANVTTGFTVDVPFTVSPTTYTVTIRGAGRNIRSNSFILDTN